VVVEFLLVRSLAVSFRDAWECRLMFLSTFFLKLFCIWNMPYAAFYHAP
jgi:hypothetical protein